MTALTDKPLASPGFNSYRYRGECGWIMIGANDDTDALVQAGRSVDDMIEVSLERLEAWDGTKYVPVMPMTIQETFPAFKPYDLVRVLSFAPVVNGIVIRPHEKPDLYYVQILSDRHEIIAHARNLEKA